MLESKLAGCKAVNLKQLAKEHFTPEFIQAQAEALLSAATRCADLGLPVVYNPSELQKCLVHHCSRELIKDLWNFSAPTIKKFIAKDGSFSLDAAVATGDIDAPSRDLKQNFDAGQVFICDTMSDLYEQWVRGLGARNKKDRTDMMSTMFMLYRSHSILINGADWDAPTIMELTLSSAGRERFDWLHDRPDMTRSQLKEISESSLHEPIALASQHGIKSATREQVVRHAVKRGEQSFVLSGDDKEIIFAPDLLGEVAAIEDACIDNYYDQTELVLQCPAKFVSSKLYSKGNMLHDLGRFRDSVFIELYLATHKRQ